MSPEEFMLNFVPEFVSEYYKNPAGIEPQGLFCIFN
jgi:hypothetical protein